MSEPFIGQITMMSFAFAPRGYAQCNGQTLPSDQNQALFALLGKTYGGNGTSNFMLPDLRGRTMVSAIRSVDPKWQPGSYPMGNMVGAETVTLTAQQIPSHAHPVYASTAPSTDGAPYDGEVLAGGSIPIYGPPSSPTVPLAGGALIASGAAAHANMQPFLTINMCIALSGIWPTRS